MAQAVCERFAPDGPVLLGGGPPIQHGFYYDFQLPRPIGEGDLDWVQARMRAIIAERHRLVRSELSAQEARRRFADQPYKLDIIAGLEAGSLDEDGQPAEREDVVFSLYRHDTFEDLCAGPHVENLSEIDPEAVQLLSVAGAHWRGDEDAPMLQRIYAAAFVTRAELEAHLERVEEAKRRDHRRLGKELELFHFEDHAPGIPYWLPNGLRILNALIGFWRERHDAWDYQEISTPLVNNKKLWEISGHWEHYRDEMFLISQGEHTCYGLKPMNCPGAMVVFNHKLRSYRELPLRLSDCDTLHRNERSGTLHGLLRVRQFRQDDAHIFLDEAQIEAEIDRVFALTDELYAIFELSYKFRLGTRPEGHIGDLATWARAEDALGRILDRHVGRSGYTIAEGDGAFYGPKIDILMEDGLGREWQMGTIQLDFHLPSRFGCSYVDETGKKQTPVVIHHVIYGSLERFLAILIEHFAGALPVWLSPVQAVVLPIADRHRAHADALSKRFRKAGLRTQVDGASERIGAKVRAAWQRRIPYVVVLGDREVDDGSISLRRRGSSRAASCSVDDFLEEARSAIAERRLDVALVSG
jgi:threonyl-tRNA synthetase